MGLGSVLLPGVQTTIEHNTGGRGDPPASVQEIMDPLGIIDKGKTDQEKEDERRLAEQQAQIQAMGIREAGLAADQYSKGEAARTGPLYEGQQASVDNQKIQDEKAIQAERNKLANFLSSIGASSSSTGIDMAGNVDQNAQVMSNNRSIMEDNMKRQNAADYYTQAQAHYDNALNALGLSAREMQALQAQHTADRQERDQAHSGLLTTVATLVGTYYGGPAGGAAAGALVGGATKKTTQAQDLTLPSDYNVAGRTFNRNATRSPTGATGELPELQNY